MEVRVRFAPSPTGSLHLGNALTAVANRRFADEHAGSLVLRIDDTDPSRTVEGGEEAILRDLAWLEVPFDDGPVRQRERGGFYRAAAERARRRGSAAGTRMGPCAWADDASARGRHGHVPARLRARRPRAPHHAHHPGLGSPTERRGATADRAGARRELPEVIHHGLVLGGDGKKLSKRHGHASVGELRDEGFPAAAVRAYLDELDLPEHDLRLDLARLRRLAVDAIAAMGDGELAAAAGAPAEVAPALRGALPSRRASTPVSCSSPRWWHSHSKRARRSSASRSCVWLRRRPGVR